MKPHSPLLLPKALVAVALFVVAAAPLQAACPVPGCGEAAPADGSRRRAPCSHTLADGLFAQSQSSGWSRSGSAEAQRQTEAMRQALELRQQRRDEIRQDFQNQAGVLQDLQRRVEQQNRDAQMRRDYERAEIAAERQQEEFLKLEREQMARDAEWERRQLEQEDRRIRLEERRFEQESRPAPASSAVHSSSLPAGRSTPVSAPSPGRAPAGPFFNDSLSSFFQIQTPPQTPRVGDPGNAQAAVPVNRRQPEPAAMSTTRFGFSLRDLADSVPAGPRKPAVREPAAPSDLSSLLDELLPR